MKNYQETLQDLRNTTKTVTEEGILTTIRLTPNAASGDIEAILLEDMQKSALGTPDVVSSLNEDAPEAPPVMPDFSNVEIATQAALQMRAMMGSPNIDLTTKIVTAEETISGKHGDIPVRIYRHEDQTEKAPALIFYHGGGFVGGTIDVVENFCKAIAEKLPAVVINVDYHLAPESPAPAATDDAFAAVTWVNENSDRLLIDSTCIGVAGDSAGGNLAAAVSYMDGIAETNIIAYQVLLYPALTLLDEDNQTYSWSIEQFEASEMTAKIVTPMIVGMGGSNQLLRTAYVRDQNPEEPIYSPLRAPDKSIFPSTMLVSAEFDFLRPITSHFGKLLQDSGVKVENIVYQGVMHAFIDKYGILPQAESCADDIVNFIKSL
ncbi:alpha/beta hydrolase [Listeria costaricensis]|uniref:alpha/beta hydrolase n=1 Tax=Listeria costaricensis TaxID=2026604 RepID=UPI000C06E22D|nr:alpha/beta hydrolase [Listeria costaricensis]